MNNKLVDLWTRAQLAHHRGNGVEVEGQYYAPLPVINTLKFVYNAFGLPNTLCAPTPQELKDYEDYGILPCVQRSDS
jgi:hypothetical protein